MSALRHACDQCGEAQRALNDLWQRTGASSLRQRLLNRLIMQLLTERKVNKDRWTVEEQEHQVRVYTRTTYITVYFTHGA